MRKVLFLVLLGTLLLGCSDQENEEVSLEAEKSDETLTEKDNSEKQSDSAQDEDTKEFQETTSNAQVEKIDIGFVKENITIGLSKKEVKELIGEPDKKGFNAMDAQPVWLYNIGVPENYSFEPQFGDEEVIDDIDIEGIKSGTLDIILIVTWQEDSVIGFNSTYVNENGETVTYYLFKDGNNKYDVHP